MEERAAVAGLGPFFRQQVSSKRNGVHSNPIFSRKAAASVHGHTGVGRGCVRVVPECAPPPPSDAKKAELSRSPSPSSSSLSSVTGRPARSVATPSSARRYQRKEVRIQEWENCQKSKFEAKMRHAEVQADQMKARAKNSLTKRLSTLSYKVEGKQARVEARRNRRAVRLARQVQRIRKTGRVPSRFRCCSWFLS
ncbi:hypothetical protein D1007_03039 [Hordeum vulgare]|nr:hypothetical protein D1007_03039 [Hordeum vulgare]